MALQVPAGGAACIATLKLQQLPLRRSEHKIPIGSGNAHNLATDMLHTAPMSQPRTDRHHGDNTRERHSSDQQYNGNGGIQARKSHSTLTLTRKIPVRLAYIRITSMYMCYCIS